MKFFMLNEVLYTCQTEALLALVLVGPGAVGLAHDREARKVLVMPEEGASSAPRVMFLVSPTSFAKNASITRS